MNCEQAAELMDGYLYGELDPITSQAIEQHLRDCHNCEQAYKAHTALLQAISLGAPYYKAPTGLRERIQSSLREEIAEQPARNIAPDARPQSATKQPEPRSIVFEASWK